MSPRDLRSVLVALLILTAAPVRADQSRAFVVTSDFSTGTLSTVDLDDHSVSHDVEDIHSDAVLRWYQGLLYVVNRFGVGGDNIQVIDPTTNATLREFSVGNGSNPQDIVFVSPTKAYVSRYASADLLVVDPSQPDGGTMTPISLADFADGDGVPDMTRMVRVERWLFVACQRLTGFVPSNPSMIAVVDTQADTVLDLNPDLPGRQGITLDLRNPISTFLYDKPTSRLFIGCSGGFGVLDGGVEAIDPVAMTSLGTVVTENDLGGDLNDIEWHNGTHAYALVSPGGTNELVTWNPATGLKLTTLLTVSGGFSLPDMEINDRGELYVCRNTATFEEPPALLVYDVDSDQLIAGPLGTQLPPVAITFDGETGIVTAVPEPVAALELAAPWPNPARERVSFSLALDRASRVALEVFDPQGRRIRTLHRGTIEAGRRDLTWDLRDDAGNRVAAGAYLARIEVEGRRAMRRVVVAR